MEKNISINDSSYAIFGKNKCIYQCVLDDFKNAKNIRIMTFNISTKADSHLIKSLRDACKNGTNATIITSIPKRYPSYWGQQYADEAKKQIDMYKQQLDPRKYGMRLNTFFAFHQHAKIIMTDNIVFWGSSNFSDESRENLECGSISTDRELIQYLKDSLFPYVEKKAIPYYKFNFAEALANLRALIPICKTARQVLFNAAFNPWADYETNFEEIWIYRTTDSGLTVSFLQGFIANFSQFENALNVIDSIIDEYCALDEGSDQVTVLKGIFDEYKLVFDSFYEKLSSLFWNLEQIAKYDVSHEACKRIDNEYGLEAFDESLDHYAQIALNEVAEEYQRLIESSEQTVRDSLNSLGTMIRYFEQMEERLTQLLEVNSKIDNTGV